MSNSTDLAFDAAWKRPLVSHHGGRTTLLVTIRSAKQPRPGERRAPLDLAFVLDRSGSMAGEKLRLVKEAVTTALGLLDDHDRAALVVYDSTVDVLQPLTPTTPRVKTAMRLALHGVDVGGSTNLSGGWLAGCDELAAAMGTRGGHRLRRALLLTDGLANAGITSEAELTHHAGELRRRGISTTALGVGDDFDEGLLTGMSEAGGGNFQNIAHPRQLAAFFQTEIGELLSVVASGLTVSMTLPAGVRATLVNAFPSPRTGKRIDVEIGNLPAGDDINLVFDLTVRPDQIGTTHMITLTVDWTAPATDRKERFDVTLPPLTVVTPDEYARCPANRLVEEEAAVQRAAIAQKEAMRLDRLGRHEESRAHLGAVASALAAAPQSARVADLSADIQMLAESDPAAGFTSSLRKQITFSAHRRSRGKQDPQ